MDLESRPVDQWGSEHPESLGSDKELVKREVGEKEAAEETELDNADIVFNVDGSVSFLCEGKKYRVQNKNGIRFEEDNLTLNSDGSVTVDILGDSLKINGKEVQEYRMNKPKYIHYKQVMHEVNLEKQSIDLCMVIGGISTGEHTPFDDLDLLDVLRIKDASEVFLDKRALKRLAS